MATGNVWDINSITPAQWTKLIASTASGKEDISLCWDGSRGIKFLQNASIPVGFHYRLSIPEIWDLTQKILTKEFHSLNSDNKIVGQDLLKQLKVLLTAEDERIKKVSTSALQSQGKEIECVRKELNELEDTLDPSTKAGTEFVEKAIQGKNVTAIQKWIAFGGNLNKQMASGSTPLTYLLRTSFFSDMFHLLINESDIFIKDREGDSGLSLFIKNTFWSPHGYAEAFLKKFKSVPQADHPALIEKLNDAFSSILSEIDLKNEDAANDFLNWVKAFAEIGLNINAFQKDGLSILAHAIQHENPKLVNKLLENGADLKKALKQLGFSKLMYVAWKGDLEAVKKILTDRTKTLLGNARDKDGNSALIWAMRMEHTDVVKYLVNIGVNLNIKNAKGHRALYYHFDPEIRSFLEHKGAKNDGGETPLMVALRERNLDVLNIDAIDHAYINAKNDFGKTTLHYAVSNGNVDLIEQFVKRGANINAVNTDGFTPLMRAILEEKFDIVEKLIKLRADLNIKNAEGKRAYDLIPFGYEYAELISLLDSAGAKNEYGINALMHAVKRRNLHEIDELIAAKFDLNAESDDGSTALTFAIEIAIDDPSYFSVVDKLLKAGACVTSSGKGDALEVILQMTDIERQTPVIMGWVETLIKEYGAKLRWTPELMFAIWKGDEEGAAKLIQTPGVNINAQDATGSTALSQAIFMKKPKLLKALIAAGADVNVGKPLLDAIQYKDRESVDLLLEAGINVNMRGEKDTPISLAWQRSMLDIVEKLINRGANPNAADVEGNTDLHLIVKGIIEDLLLNDLSNISISKVSEVLKLLKKGKVNFDAQNREGKTALQLALDLCLKKKTVNIKSTSPVIAALIPLTNMALRDGNGHTPLISVISAQDRFFNKNIIPLFLDAKINANLKDSKGNSPLYWAAMLGEQELVDQLIIYGVDLDAENNSERTIVESLHDKIVALENEIAVSPDALQSSLNRKMIELTRKIIQKLQNAGAKNHHGLTPLMFAVGDPDEKRAYERVKYWIAKGADVNARDNRGTTAATYAVHKGRTIILELLIQAGADLLIRDNKLMNPFFAGCVKENREILCLILPFLEPFIKDLEYLSGHKNLQQLEKFVKKIMSTLSPTERCKALILPYFVDSRKMGQFMMKELTEEQKQRGLEFLKKCYPTANLNWLQDSEIIHSQSHFQIIEEAVPAATKSVDLDSFLRMFDKINTKFPKKPGYLDPARLMDDGVSKTLQQIRGSLELLLTRVKNKKEGFLATPKEGTPALVEYYSKLENSLAFIVDKISDPSWDPDVRTSVLFDLAIAGSHCGARYKTETAAWHRLLTKGVETLTLRQEIDKILQNTRIGVIEKMAKQTTYSNGVRIGVGNRPHTYNQIVRMIGTKWGIPGVSETYQDTAFWLDFLNASNLNLTYSLNYTPTNIIDRIDTAVNGVTDSRGNRIPASREIHPLVIESWFKERMPKDWKLKEALSFTRIEVDGNERELDYQTFFQVVNKEFEGEKKRLAELSAADIVKETNPKINDYLFSQYRIKLVDDVDPQNWEQVEKSINAQLKELRGGYRGLLEQPGKLDEIKAYIKQNFKGRQNYTRYALTVMLSKFGIIAPFRLEWDAVSQAIENTRAQEYVNTAIRDKNGLIPRQTIRDMLIEIGILVRT